MKNTKQGKTSWKVIVFVFSLLVAIIAWLAFVFYKSQEKNTEPALGYVNGAEVSDSLVEYRPAIYDSSDDLYFIKGTVENTINSVSTVLVTATNHETGFRTTASAVDGEFHIPDLNKGLYTLKARSEGLVSISADTIDLNSNKTLVNPLVLSALDAYPYPSGYYAAMLDFPSEEIKNDTRLSCGYCHSIANPIFRAPRDIGVFTAIVDNMDAYGALPRELTKEALPAIFSNGFKNLVEPTLPEASQMWQFAYDYNTTEYIVKEWPMGEIGAYIHDIAIGPDKWISGVDMELDNVYSLNVETGEYKHWRLNARGHPLGGSYASGMSHPVGTTQSYMGPHSIEYSEGKYWITASLANEIVAFSPDSSSSRRWSMPFKSFYPHTLRVAQNDVYFTVALSNHFGHLSTESNAISVLPLPTKTSGQDRLLGGLAFSFGYSAKSPKEDRHMKWWLKMFRGDGSENMPLAYGIDIHPTLPIACYSQVYIDRIGCIDLNTGENILDVQTPFQGPRRLRFSSDGKLWIPGFVSGTLASFNLDSHEFELITELPVPIEGWKEQPYALNIHPETGNIWVTGTAFDVLYEYDVDLERWRVYPLPFRGAYMREIEFSADGWVCTSYASTPDYHMPDVSVKMMCLKTSDIN